MQEACFSCEKPPRHFRFRGNDGVVDERGLEVMDVNFVDHDFVKFAEQLAAQPRTQVALHQLESRNTLNVNLILYAIWCGQHQQGRLLKQDLKKLISSIRSWQECVRFALQRLINTVSQTDSDSSQKLQKLITTELKITNQIEQRLLTETLIKFNGQARSPAQQLSDACSSISSYCRLLHLGISEEDRKAISTLLQASFSNLIAADIEHVCKNSLSYSMTRTPYAQLPLGEI